MSDQNEKSAEEGRKAFLGLFELISEKVTAPHRAFDAVAVSSEDGTIKIGSSIWKMIESTQPGDQEFEAEALALMQTFDSRITESEKRIDRVLARLGVE